MKVRAVVQSVDERNKEARATFDYDGRVGWFKVHQQDSRRLDLKPGDAIAAETDGHDAMLGTVARL